MKKLIVLIALALAVNACAPQQADTASQRNEALRSYADQFASWYPDAEQNIAQVCLDDPGPTFTMDNLTAYTCALPEHPGVYGVVTFDSAENVLDAFSVRANTEGELTSVMQAAGWR